MPEVRHKAQHQPCGDATIQQQCETAGEGQRGGQKKIGQRN